MPQMIQSFGGFGAMTLHFIFQSLGFLYQFGRFAAGGFVGRLRRRLQIFDGSFQVGFGLVVRVSTVVTNSAPQ